MGAYHSAASRRFCSITTCEVSHTSGWNWPSGASGVPDTFMATMPKTSRPETSESNHTQTGTTSSAVSPLESTVASSDTGSDFQNRMLRSLRSAYRQSSR